MENATCKVIYVDKRAKDEIVQKDLFANETNVDSTDTLRATLTTILSTFPSSKLVPFG
jgi:hypothetical protein